MPKITALSRAVGTLTLSGQPLNTETVVVGGKTYTFQTTLTDVDGNVKIGTNAAESITNLQAAIHLGAGAGTNYAASMTRNNQVRVSVVTATTLVVECKTPGTIGNLVASTETLTNGSWGGALLTGGTGDVSLAIQEIRSAGQLNSDVLTALDAIDAAAGGEA